MIDKQKLFFALIMLTVCIWGLNGCSIIGPSKRVDEPFLAWSAPDQRTYRSFRSWGCFSATGNCSSWSWRSHSGRSVSVDYEKLKAFLRETFWDDALFFGFIDRFGPKPLNERHPGFETWQQSQLSFSSTYCGTLPYKTQIVSVNPDIAVVSKDFDCIIKRVFHYSYEKSEAEALARYEALQKLYPEVTPAAERRLSSASTELKKYSWYQDRSLDNNTRLPYRHGEPVTIIYLDDWRHETLVAKWPQVIRLGDNDYLHLTIIDEELDVIRTSRSNVQ